VTVLLEDEFPLVPTYVKLSVPVKPDAGKYKISLEEQFTNREAFLAVVPETLK